MGIAFVSGRSKNLLNPGQTSPTDDARQIYVPKKMIFGTQEAKNSAPMMYPYMVIMQKNGPHQFFCFLYAANLHH
jgi:hypothetical protein